MNAYNERFINEFEVQMKGVMGEKCFVEYALFHALKMNIEKLPSMYNKGVFHKMLRQTDVTDSGHMDIIIWNLLHASKLFWELELPRKKKEKHANKDRARKASCKKG